MTLSPTVLFRLPRHAIASLIVDRLSKSISTRIITGFATEGGLAAIAEPIEDRPSTLTTLVVGAATYGAFGVMDDLVNAGVPNNRLYVHLGHTSETRGKRNPFARYRPMLHSKIYYMELPDSSACALIGSHNLTAYAMGGLNGEASIMLEGPMNAPEFDKVRSHIEAARREAATYSPGMKDAYAWWMREFLEGLRAEVGIPQDWTTIRTILLFVAAAKNDRPKEGDHLYFEIPAGIEQIETLKTETHLFLFETLPADPWQALTGALKADATYLCRTLGAENKQGNRELDADWRVDGAPRPTLQRVPGGILRPDTPEGMQQVRAEVGARSVEAFEYQFERERVGWDPEFSAEETLRIPGADETQDSVSAGLLELPGKSRSEVVLKEMRGGDRAPRAWRLVKGLVHRGGSAREKDEVALSLAAPDSGSFVLVSLRRRRRDKSGKSNKAR
ncbi:hypothetical protein FHP25_17900 [Vineibacter terrae]|uniref:NgoFVII family restriction endonuclease n=1 Tax=Vineibacter terrae TaxID=2586908 RepID=A0A5C8PJR9_9HYPH|nr:hypothetical protein [Vineibacter terrae]TXL74082.1 hypothetical protein FHP25_17900 [Vineibacter terrae]